MRLNLASVLGQRLCCCGYYWSSWLYFGLFSQKLSATGKELNLKKGIRLHFRSVSARGGGAAVNIVAVHFLLVVSLRVVEVHRRPKPVGISSERSRGLPRKTQPRARCRVHAAAAFSSINGWATALSAKGKLRGSKVRSRESVVGR